MIKQTFHFFDDSVPECPPVAIPVHGCLRLSKEPAGKPPPLPLAAVAAPLQDIVDRVASHPSLTASRRRDLRSAVIILAKLMGQPLRQVQVDLAEIRRVL